MFKVVFFCSKTKTPLLASFWLAIVFIESAVLKEASSARKRLVLSDSLMDCKTAADSEADLD